MEFDRLKELCSRPASAIDEIKERLTPLSAAEQLRLSPSALTVTEQLKRERDLMERAFGRPIDTLEKIRADVDAAFGRPIDNLGKMKADMLAAFERPVDAMAKIRADMQEQFDRLHRNSFEGPAEQRARAIEGLPELLARQSEQIAARERAISSMRTQFTEPLTRVAERMTRAADDLFPGRRTAADVMREVDVRALRETFVPSPRPYVPPMFETPNCAKEKIASIRKDETDKRDALPFGKVLKMVVAVGGIQFFVSGADAFTAQDKSNIEIAAFNGENVVTLNAPYDQIVIIYEVSDLDVPDDETIH